MEGGFGLKLKRATQTRGSLLVLGLDPDPALMPEKDILAFNRAIIEATQDLVCAYKPNLAFYEALGLKGMEALARTLEAIPSDIPVIGDAKRGDVGHTAKAYARALFEAWGFDAATVNPYLGYDALEPFLEYKDRGVFLLCRTSNPGAADFQNLQIGNRPLYQVVAEKAREWDRYGNLGLVVGATYPQELQEVRRLCPNMLFLIPGIGPQGGDLELAVKYGLAGGGEAPSTGSFGFAQDRSGQAIFAVSRQVLYASRGKDFAQAARKEAERLREQINALIEPSKPSQG